jgi:hypothetical protein
MLSVESRVSVLPVSAPLEQAPAVMLPPASPSVLADSSGRRASAASQTLVDLDKTRASLEQQVQMRRDLEQRKA